MGARSVHSTLSRAGIGIALHKDGRIGRERGGLWVCWGLLYLEAACKVSQCFIGNQLQLWKPSQACKQRLIWHQSLHLKKIEASPLALLITKS